MSDTADVVVIGAGIAGIAGAYFLTVEYGVDHVMIVDPRPPLSLTSDKSTECYRNWWPDLPMVGLMNRSIDLLEEMSAHVDFGLNSRGYLYVTSDPSTLETMTIDAGAAAELEIAVDVLDDGEVRERYPFLTETAAGALEVHRAGWMRAQTLGRHMLDRAREHGAELRRATVTEVDSGLVGLDDGSKVAAPAVVLAAGPLTPDLARLAGLELPLHSELHLKVSFKDHLGVIPRDAPMTIWADPQQIEWSEEERSALEELGRADVLGMLPRYCHFRPEGGPESPYVVGLWEYHHQVMVPTWPVPDDDLYPEMVIRGLTTMVPGLAAYRDRLPGSFVDGGYYTKTPENRPLIGPSPVDGLHLMTGMSGFGVMVAAGAADLLAAHVTGSSLPDYAWAFLTSRYDDDGYAASLDALESGQL